MPAEVMTSDEFIATRTRLGLNAEQIAADFGVTPHVVAAWENGTVRVSSHVARSLRWQAVVAERAATVAASGLPECPVLEALESAMEDKEGDELLAAFERIGPHAESCAVCRARAEYADAHGPRVPDVPMPRWMRIAGAVNTLFDRLPSWLRPPNDETGQGRRIGLWVGVMFSALAVVISAAYIVRAAGAPGALREGAVLLAVIIPAYIVGFYGAGAAYDALRPIGHRFIGYVLRWGLGGAIVYGTIALSMPLISEDPMSWSGAGFFTLLMGSVWALIGAGVWVKHRITGKLPKPAG